MNWKDLVEILEGAVPAGSITTYAEVSRWAYGNTYFDRPIRSMINCARKNGFLTVTNRVVCFDGKLAVMYNGADQQRQQLLIEGLPFTEDGRVDLEKVVPIVLADRIGP